VKPNLCLMSDPYHHRLYRILLPCEADADNAIAGSLHKTNKMSGQQNLFPSMGDIASRTNALRDVEDDDKRLAHDAPTLEEQEEGEEREVQEIESLCMRCHEQVSICLIEIDSPLTKRGQRDYC
jgi:hypothetical protein